MPRPTPAPRAKAARTANTAPHDVAGTVRFGPKNWMVMGAALVSIAAGFALLAGGSVSLAATLLVLGYVVLVPVGIVL